MVQPRVRARVSSRTETELLAEPVPDEASDDEVFAELRTLALARITGEDPRSHWARQHLTVSRGGRLADLAGEVTNRSEELRWQLMEELHPVERARLLVADLSALGS